MPFLLGPKSCLGGTVKIARSIVGIGATVKHGLQIGDDNLLAANVLPINARRSCLHGCTCRLP